MRFASLLIVLCFSLSAFSGNWDDCLEYSETENFVISASPMSSMIIASAGPNCDNSGTPGDPFDDVYTITVKVHQQWGSGGSWIASDPFQTTGNYGEEVVLGPYPVVDGPFDLVFTDVEDSTCSEPWWIFPPASCIENWEESPWLSDQLSQVDGENCGCTNRIAVYMYEGNYFFLYDGLCSASTDMYDYFTDINGNFLCGVDYFPLWQNVQCSEEFLNSIELVEVLYDCPLPHPCEEEIVIEAEYGGCYEEDCVSGTEYWCFSVEEFVYTPFWSVLGVGQSHEGTEFCVELSSLVETEVCVNFLGLATECETETCVQVEFSNQCITSDPCLFCGSVDFTIEENETLQFSILDYIAFAEIPDSVIFDIEEEASFGNMGFTPAGLFYYWSPTPGFFSIEYEICSQDGSYCCYNYISVTVGEECDEGDGNQWLMENTPEDADNCDCVDEIKIYDYLGKTVYLFDSRCNFDDESDYYADCNGVFICAINGPLTEDETCSTEFLEAISFTETYFECQEADYCDQEIELSANYISCTNSGDIPQSEVLEDWCFSVENVIGDKVWSLDGVVLEFGSEACLSIDALTGTAPEVCINVELEDCTIVECASFTLSGECIDNSEPFIECADFNLNVEGASSTSMNLLGLTEGNSTYDVVFSMDTSSDFGEVSFTSDGQFSFAAFSNGNGVENFNYEACLTSTGICCEAVLSVSVTPEDGAVGPEMTADVYNIEGESMLICPLENDLFEAETFSFEWASEEENLTITEEANNCLFIEINNVEPGVSYLGTYTVCLPNNSCSTSSFELVFPENPALMPDFYTIESDSLLFCPLENDSVESSEFSFEWTFENDNIAISEQNDNCLLLVINGNLDLVGFYSGSYTVCLPNDICSSSSFELEFPVGLETLDSDFTIYPNPASQRVFVESEHELLKKVGLYTISGSMVQESAVDGNYASVNVSDLLPGIYLLVIKGESSNRVERIVVE